MTSNFQNAVEQKATLDNTINPQDQAQVAIASYKKKFQLLMPKGADDADQIVMDAVQALETNPKLRECDPMTVLGGLVTISQLGLRPNVLGQSYLVPMWNGRNKRFEATMIVGYQGLLTLAYRTADVKHAESRVVYEGDLFEFSFDYNQLVHSVDITKPKGVPVVVYSVVHMANGFTHVERPMTIAELEEHRDKYAMARKKDGTVVGPWRTEFIAMARKTMLVKALKYLPKSIVVQQAEVVDGSVRTDVMERSPERAVDTRVLDGMLGPDQEGAPEGQDATQEGGEEPFPNDDEGQA